MSGFLSPVAGLNLQLAVAHQRIALLRKNETIYKLTLVMVEQIVDRLLQSAPDERQDVIFQAELKNMIRDCAKRTGSA